MGADASHIETFVELIRRASTDLAEDVVAAIEEGRKSEESGGLASIAFDTILNNIEIARDNSAPICQDTGTPVVWIHHPAGVSTRGLKHDFEAAVRKALPDALDLLTICVEAGLGFDAAMRKVAPNTSCPTRSSEPGAISRASGGRCLTRSSRRRARAARRACSVSASAVTGSPHSRHRRSSS